MISGKKKIIIIRKIEYSVDSEGKGDKIIHNIYLNKQLNFTKMI